MTLINRFFIAYRRVPIFCILGLNSASTAHLECPLALILMPNHLRTLSNVIWKLFGNKNIQQHLCTSLKTSIICLTRYFFKQKWMLDNIVAKSQSDLDENFKGYRDLPRIPINFVWYLTLFGIIYCGISQYCFT